MRVAGEHHGSTLRWFACPMLQTAQWRYVDNCLIPWVPSQQRTKSLSELSFSNSRDKQRMEEMA